LSGQYGRRDETCPVSTGREGGGGGGSVLRVTRGAAAQAMPSVTDSSAAPPGAQSVMVLVPCGCMPDDRASPGLYDKVVADAREAVLARFERQGVHVRSPPPFPVLTGQVSSLPSY